VAPLNKNPAPPRSLVFASGQPTVRLAHMDHIEPLAAAAFGNSAINTMRQLQKIVQIAMPDSLP